MNLASPHPKKVINLAGKARDVQRALEKLTRKGKQYSITISSEDFTFDVFEHGMPTGGAFASNEKDLAQMIEMSLTEFDPLEMSN